MTVWFYRVPGVALANDPYAELSLPRSATADEVRKAFRKLAKQYHPDANPGNDAAEGRFKPDELSAGATSAWHEMRWIWRLADPTLGAWRVIPAVP